MAAADYLTCSPHAPSNKACLRLGRICTWAWSPHIQEAHLQHEMLHHQVHLGRDGGIDCHTLQRRRRQPHCQLDGLLRLEVLRTAGQAASSFSKFPHGILEL